MSTAGFSAVVLAAGAGRRFGGGKLLAPWRGRPLIAWALEAAWALPATGVLLVTGADPRVGPVAEALANGRPLRIVHADDHTEGMGASLRAGLAALPSDTTGAFVLLGDMPDVPHHLLAALAAAVAAGAPAAAPVHAGRRGHPVALGARLVALGPMLSGDAGARALLEPLGGRLVTVEGGPGVLSDVDTPDAVDPARGRVAFQGALGAYSHLACLAFLPDFAPLPLRTFEDVWSAVETGRCERAIVPVENSYAGPVQPVVDLLSERPLPILSQPDLPIRLALMGAPGVGRASIQRVASHPMALKQCASTLRANGWAAEPHYDTAGAAADLAAAPRSDLAVAGPALAAALYGLEVLDPAIEDQPGARTRFLVLAPPPAV